MPSNMRISIKLYEKFLTNQGEIGVWVCNKKRSFLWDKGDSACSPEKTLFFVTKEITLVLPDTWVTGKQCFVWFFREVKFSNSRL